MSSVELTLDFLWEFLSPVLSDAVKEKIKPKKSEEKAKEKAFKLYQILTDIDRISETYVNAFQAYVEATLSNPNDKNYPQGLSESITELTHALPLLIDALNAINPQLGIYRHDLDSALKLYLRSRGDVIRQLHGYIENMDRLQPEDLQKLLSSSMKNQKLITKAIKEMREFLAEEFPFKESF